MSSCARFVLFAAALTSIAAVSAPGSAEAGILIGNPLVLRIQPLDSSTIDEASGWLEEVVLDDCNGKTWTVVVDDAVDLVDDVDVVIPSDDWCKATLVFTDDIHLEGDNGSSYSEDVDGTSVVMPRLETTGFDGFVLSDLGATNALLEVSGEGQ